MNVNEIDYRIYEIILGLVIIKSKGLININLFIHYNFLKLTPKNRHTKIYPKYSPN